MHNMFPLIELMDISIYFSPQVLAFDMVTPYTNWTGFGLRSLRPGPGEIRGVHPTDVPIFHTASSVRPPTKKLCHAAIPNGVPN